MKTLFIEAKSDVEIQLTDKEIAKLPKEIALFTTVQFIGNIPSIKKQLENKGIIVKLFKPRHCRYYGQLLGCSIEKFPSEAFLYIGDGMFHPTALKIKNDMPVYIYNPFTKKLIDLEEKDTQKIKLRQKGALIKFHSSKEIGVIISIKPGQYRLQHVQRLKQKYPDKNFYFLLFDTIDFPQLENFPFIECFVNTACLRISCDDYEKFPRPVLNIEEVL